LVVETITSNLRNYLSKNLIMTSATT